VKEAAYRISFTAGGLFVRELSTIAVGLLEKAYWQTVEERVVAINRLQTRTVDSSIRILREVKHRLAVLGQEELRILINGDLEVKEAVAWLSVSRVYKIIIDLSTEVINDRFQYYRSDIHFEDFDFLLNKKDCFYPELEALKDSTRLKLRQVSSKMMRKNDKLEQQLFPCLQTLSAGGMRE